MLGFWAWARRGERLGAAGLDRPIDFFFNIQKFAGTGFEPMTSRL